MQTGAGESRWRPAPPAVVLAAGLIAGGFLGRLLGGGGDDGIVRTFRAEVTNVVTEMGTICVTEDGTGRHEGCGILRLAQGQTLPTRGAVVVLQEVETPESEAMKVLGTRLYVLPLERQYFK